MFVFSLEDEISFQTVYNYFLRLCSFRNASEVPMVLVGTQGERARWAVLVGGGGMEVLGAAGPGEKAPCYYLLVLSPSSIASERAPPPCSPCAGPSPVGASHRCDDRVHVLGDA